MITLDSIYTIITPVLGLGSAILAVFTFSSETIPTLPVGADISPMTLIISLIATFLLGLMRTTNSVKNLEETNTKILTTQNDILKVQNELLKTLTNDSVKQDKLIELETKSLEANNKTLTSMNRMLIANNAKKPGRSGTFPVDRS